MKISIFRFPFLFGGHVAAAACLLGFLPSLVAAPGRKYPPTNAAGMPVVDTNGKRINYIHEFVAAISPASKDATRTSVKGQTTSTGASSRFIAATASTARPFWQYAIFGSGIGASNIVIGPAPAGGSAPEIIIGGNSWNGFGPDDFWQVIRHNSKTGNYDQVFVSPVYSDAAGYSASINRIGVANVVGDLNPEIVVMLEDGRIYLYDLVTKTELGHIETGISGLEGLSLADLDSDGHAELIVTTGSDLFVFNGAGTLLWQVPSAGGQDVVAGQMDDDPAIEIASSSGKVVDASTHTVQWTYNNGLAPHI